MQKIKGVYFARIGDVDKVRNNFFGERKYNFLGSVRTFNGGLSLVTYGNNKFDYIPVWIIKAILCYIEKQRKKLVRSYMIPNKDYLFYVKMFEKDCLVEVMQVTAIIA